MHANSHKNRDHAAALPFKKRIFQCEQHDNKHDNNFMASHFSFGSPGIAAILHLCPKVPSARKMSTQQVLIGTVPNIHRSITLKDSAASYEQNRSHLFVKNVGDFIK